MKLQASRPISPKNLQSQTSSQTKNRLAISRLGILHGRLFTLISELGGKPEVSLADDVRALHL